jgi:DNA polymerase III epsilon subunit-like protein
MTDYRLAELATGHWRVKFRLERSTAEAREIFGYDGKLWADAFPIRQVLEEIGAMCPQGVKVVPAGQNVRMDVMYLERAFKDCEIPYPFDYHVIDLATLFYSWSLVAGEEVPALSLRQAATTAGLVDGPVPHRALDDARLTLETFRHYIGRLAAREPAVSPAEPAGAEAAASGGDA